MRLEAGEQGGEKQARITQGYICLQRAFALLLRAMRSPWRNGMPCSVF